MEEFKAVRKWFQKGFVCLGLDLEYDFLHVPMRSSIKKILDLKGKKTLGMASFILWLKMFSKNTDLHCKTH